MPPATILHISDLHLGGSLDDTGRSGRGTFWSAFRGGSPVMQSHNPFILAILHDAILSASRALNSGDEFDFTVVTGDISTRANSDDRFAFARKFLLQRFAGTGALDHGLGLPADRIACVPGNHDKLEEITLARYLTAFKTLPPALPYAMTRTARNGQSITFYGIDSNAYREGNIAIGEITPSTLPWLSAQLTNVAAGRRKAGDPLRVLLLHHHPCNLERLKRQGLGQRLVDALGRRRLTRLEQAEQLLDACRGRIDVIMHGHEHFPVVFQDERSGCLVISAGSTSEFHGACGGNSFHGIAIEKDRIRVLQFDYTGGRFPPGREWTYDLASGTLEGPPDEEPVRRSTLRAALRWLKG